LKPKKIKKEVGMIIKKEGVEREDVSSKKINQFLILEDYYNIIVER